MRVKPGPMGLLAGQNMFELWIFQQPWLTRNISYLCGYKYASSYLISGEIFSHNIDKGRAWYHCVSVGVLIGCCFS